MGDPSGKGRFYEQFWQDASYQEAYAFDSAVRDRYPAIRRVWGELRRPKRVLDYGCGNGVLTYWLWWNGFGEEIIGVDISHTGIESARRNFSKPGLRFETLETVGQLASGSFDVVVSSHVLEHVDNPQTALSTMAEKAEWLVIEVPLERCLWPEVATRLRGRSRKDNPLGHVNFWDRTGFKAFLHNHGLLVIREYQYASAPYSPFNHPFKRFLERIALKILGLSLYGKILATHLVVLARKMS
ncbi:MAG: class I SAM-dependent methyltransferase [Nitrospirae bacterium]|nr:MAG: class I SAM-dependent methyltransferase [Nitrospirota bacterium]